jgi:hypothetical protein
MMEYIYPCRSDWGPASINFTCMRHLDFVACPADPDVWMQPAKKSDGSEYYEYVLLYTDGVLTVSDNAEKVLREEIG